jgi:hypothetical protein
MDTKHTNADEAVARSGQNCACRKFRSRQEFKGGFFLQEIAETTENDHNGHENDRTGGNR